MTESRNPRSSEVTSYSGHAEPLPRLESRNPRSSEITSYSGHAESRNPRSSEINSYSDGQSLTSRATTAAAHEDGNMAHPNPSSPVDYHEAESTMGLARRVFQLDSQDLGQLATSALPDGDISKAALNSGQATPNPNRFPIKSVLGCALPSEDLMRILLEEYFDSVHWFSLAIYEPKFRIDFESICDGFARSAQDGFLMLLTVVLGIAAWYRSKRIQRQHSETEADWNAWSVQLIKHAESRLFDILEQGSLSTIQTCILLGSYNSYHGKPKSAFALLGATIKIAQAIGLHREPLKGGSDASEERKRTWWTIYTWDRWASITYGRPLGINDKDCNISMPGDVYEKWQFKASPDQNEEAICYSTYQRELNKLYIASSPLIKTIFGIRSHADVEGQIPSSRFPRMMENVFRQLSYWRDSLPAHLVFDFDQDISPDASVRQKAFHLQALSLQLTFDHLVVILHRPSLVQQISNLSLHNGQDTSSPFSATSHLNSPATSLSASSPCAQLPSSEEWWSAALRTSRVTQLPQVVRLAIDGHLVAFLAINLFNAAIVMIVCALSNPLSDRAQNAKRQITLVWRLQELLSRRSKLSMQSCDILKAGVWMMVKREGEAMLASVNPRASLETVEGGGHEDGNTRDGSWQGQADPLEVENTLRIPISIPSEHISMWQENPGVIRELDETVRLEESLLSLQKVFPGNDFINYQPNDTGNQESVLQNEPIEMWQGGGSHFESNEDYRGDFDASIADDGLYWIWNSSGMS